MCLPWYLKRKEQGTIRLNEDVKQLSQKQQLNRLDLLSPQKRKFMSMIKISKIISTIENVDRDLLVFFPAQAPSDGPHLSPSQSREFQNKQKAVILHATGFMTVALWEKMLCLQNIYMD